MKTTIDRTKLEIIRGDIARQAGVAAIVNAANARLLPGRGVAGAIHRAAGPVYGKDKPEDRLLANCYYNALHIADREKVDSLAFPSISTGVFGYPIGLAARVCLHTLREVVPRLRHVRKIRLVLFGEADVQACEEAWATLDR